MTRLIGCTTLFLLTVQMSVRTQEYQVSGVVLQVDPARNGFSASIRAIPGFMPAMAMPFEVREKNDLAGLVPGAAVEFILVVSKTSSYAERIRIVPYRSVEQDPLTANRLRLLTRLAGTVSPRRMAIGDAVPDFRLTDQAHQPIALSDLRGKVVAINFVYTRCALPNFCLRIANNFGAVRKRLAPQLGRDLILLTVTFDPARDTPEVLAHYAAQWNADPASWHFLTGPVADIQRVCQLFGVDAFPDEGLMSHSLHTAILDREGRLAANLEGNQFTVDQLGDLIKAVLGRGARQP
jgi:protein SCO1/2